jgi:hypothetical protein
VTARGVATMATKSGATREESAITRSLSMDCFINELGEKPRKEPTTGSSRRSGLAALMSPASVESSRTTRVAALTRRAGGSGGCYRRSGSAGARRARYCRSTPICDRPASGLCRLLLRSQIPQPHSGAQSKQLHLLQR